MRWSQRLVAASDAADPALVPWAEGTVKPPARRLCGGLSLLAQVTAEDLGASTSADPGAHCGALLAILTKIDDEVIDAMAFHGGRATDRTALGARLTGFLAPTLAAVARGAADPGAEARVRLAAELGRALQDPRFDQRKVQRLQGVLAEGWAIQDRGVRILTADPATTTRDEVLAVTRDISGAWLWMIALCGALGVEPPHDVLPDEREAVWDWGLWMQSADALSDLHKDLGDGHINSIATHRLHEVVGPAMLEWADQEPERIVAEVSARGLDEACLPEDAQVEAIGRRLSRLPQLHGLLSWTHTFLCWRWAHHPLRRGPLGPRLEATLARHDDAQAYLAAMAARMGRP